MDNIKKNIFLTPFNILYKISPVLDLKLLYRIKQGHKLDLKSPKAYTEKLQWIKLYDKNELMPKCCDKYTVREYVEKMGCSDILNTLYWHGTDPDKIPYDELPEKFVIKVTHGSTFNIFVTDKSQLDKAKISKKLNRWLKTRFLPCYGEWFYGVEKPRIIVEKYIESTDDAQLRDYKVFCFNGMPKMIKIDTDRFTDHKNDFYDCDWNRIEDAAMYFPNSGRNFEKPECLQKMLDYAGVLSSPFKHARIDYYIADNRLIFGEVTFTTSAGFHRFLSRSFDEKMGSWLDLNR